MIGVVPVDERVLAVQRRDNGHWEPPAGVLERDETFQQGVEREVLEETGVVVRAIRVTGLYKNLVHPLRPVSIAWLCEYVSGEARASDESSDTRWLTLDEVRSYMVPAHAARIVDAVEPPSDGHIPVRAHNGVILLPVDARETIFDPCVEADRQ
jgi:8-oxo-dGTP diphosphatase